MKQFLEGQDILSFFSVTLAARGLQNKQLVQLEAVHKAAQNCATVLLEG